MLTSLKSNLSLFTFLLILFAGNPLVAQKSIYELQNLGVREGLPNSNTFNMIQDEDHFIWISTPGSLLRYDGYNFKSYDASFFGIAESSTLSLALDDHNMIWFCENLAYIQSPQNGVFDPRTDRVISFKEFSKGLIATDDVAYINASKYDKSIIFLVTKSGIVYKYDGDFEEIFRFKGEEKVYRVISEIDSNGNYWITFDSSKILKINRLKQVVGQYQVSPNFVIRRFFFTNNQVIFGGYDLELDYHYWQLDQDRVVPLKDDYSADLFILDMNKDQSFYVSNDSLFKAYDFSSTRQNHIFLGDVKANRLNDSFIDEQGILWISSDRGIKKVITKINPFTVYQRGNSIRAIQVIDDKLWMGGYTNNVIYDFEKNTADILELDNRTITGVFIDSQEHIWLGTNVNKCFQLDSDGNLIDSYISDYLASLLLPFENSKTGRIWIGKSKGLSYIDEKGTYKDYKYSNELDNAYIRQFLPTADGIWVVSNKGLFLIDANRDEVINHYSTPTGLPSDNINHIYVDEENILWMATKFQGLVKWDLINNTFEQFTTKDGLSNNTIYAVYEDNFNILWLPSNYGLMRFDKVSNSTQVYTVDDGIADNEFNTYSHYRDAQGIFYFGGISGVTAFNPKDFIDLATADKPIILSDVSVLRKKANDFLNLPSNPDIDQPIPLFHDDQILRLEVNLLDFKYLGGHQYAYKIDGYHNNWLYTRNNQISIYNFPYGNHTISIKAKGDRDLWSSTQFQIPIRVEKPFYLKWQYIALFIAALLSVFYIYYQRRIKNLNAAKFKLEQEVTFRTHQIEEDKKVIELQAEELKVMDKAKELFFSNLTHEFRTPLTLIIGPLEQMINEPPPTSVFKQKASNILKNARHILGLINQLLDLSKLENKQMSLDYIDVDVILHTKELLERFKALAQQSDQQLTFTSNLASWQTGVDLNKWDKIIYNLVSNALKFTPEGGHIHIQVNKSTIEDNDGIELIVSDSGMGIDEENRNKIFNRFYQVDLSSTRINQGTGIGLSLVKELVELQNGSILIQSEPQEGATFIVNIPIPKFSINKVNTFEVPSSYEISLPDSAPARTIISSNTHKKIDLLLVEDNEEMRDYISHCLDHELYDISTARNGEEGLQKARTQIPDLIISDVMMPLKNGFDLVQDLRNEMSTSHIPIILLTAKTGMESRLEGLERGADSYLVKPFNPKELAVQVKNLIDSRKRLQERYSKNEQAEDPTYIKEDQFISRLREFVVANLGRSDLNGDVIGANFGLSRIHLYRKLKALTNASISEFVKEIRLEKSVELLQEGRMNISEIAYEVGFTSPSHFSRSFKDKYGKSPSQW